MSDAGRRRFRFVAGPSFSAVPFLVFFSLSWRWWRSWSVPTLPHISTLDLFVTAPRQQAQFVDRPNVRIYEGDPLLFWRLLPNLHDVAVGRDAR